MPNVTFGGKKFESLILWLSCDEAQLRGPTPKALLYRSKMGTASPQEPIRWIDPDTMGKEMHRKL
ncbi:hypothetical protein WH297_17910 [Ochrobactrum vermis]|uniref:Uncharacterized protein n=1 Tax=Ochrobactrum vermis TaxID=1827297 RepID=A0ABU8PHB4_9HYPH|nr:hypothetical protein [Ochrobactrum vermis]